ARGRIVRAASNSSAGTNGSQRSSRKSSPSASPTIPPAAARRNSTSCRATRPAERSGALGRLRLDRFHVLVRKAEMVADLVDEDVRDDRAQRLLVLGPIVEDGAAIEPDLVGQHAGRIAGPALQRPHAP